MRATVARRLLAALGLALVMSSGSAQAADPVRVYAAGSLGNVLPGLIKESGVPVDSVTPVFGPAGALRQRLQSGEHADLFLSADMAQPMALAGGAGVLVMPFVRNRMCLAATPKVGLTADNMLDRMLSPDVRLATSTPGADPGGDYARAVFARAEALHPGAQAALVAKSMMLVGGPGSMTSQPGHSPVATIFLGDHADAMLYYCSGNASTLKEVPGLISVPLPDAIAVDPVYGMALLSDRPEVAKLALFILSEHGQAILAKAGLLPLVPFR